MIEKFKNNIEIHFFYIFLILVAIIIFMASVSWSELDNFTQYLSTAATFTSLILGLLAIVYAYITNDSLGKSLGSISESSRHISASTEEVKAVRKNIDDSISNSVAIKDTVQEMIAALKLEIANLHTTAENLRDENSNLRLNINENFESLNRTVLEIRTNDYIGINSSNRSDDKAELFKNESYVGLLCLYALQKSNENSKSIVLGEAFIDSDHYPYFLGYVSALTNFTDVDFELKTEGDMDKWEVSILNFDDSLFGAEEELNKRNSNNDTDERRINDINHLKKYFSDKN